MLRQSAMVSKRSHRGLQALNWGIVCVSISILLTFMVSFIVAAFATSVEQGIQSLAAVVLPPLSISFLVLFTDLFKNRDANVPQFSLYFISTVWMLILLILMQEYVDAPGSVALPLIELLFSITLAVLIWIYQGVSFRALRACCYGIVSGLLMYLVVL